MSKFTDALSQTDSAFFDVFGDKAFISGRAFSCIFDDETFVDDNMQQKQRQITLKKDDVRFFQAADVFIVNAKKWRLGSIMLDDHNDTMQTFELIDAN